MYVWLLFLWMRYTVQYSLAQSQQWRHHRHVQILFKVNNKTPEHWFHYLIPHIALASFPLLTLGKQMPGELVQCSIVLNLEKFFRLLMCSDKWTDLLKYCNNIVRQLKYNSLSYCQPKPLKLQHSNFRVNNMTYSLKSFIKSSTKCNFYESVTY